jgi:hypothetical protein
MAAGIDCSRQAIPARQLMIPQEVNIRHSGTEPEAGASQRQREEHLDKLLLSSLPSVPL